MAKFGGSPRHYFNGKFYLVPMPHPTQSQGHLFVEPWERSESTCDCCGKQSSHVWGALNTDSGAGVALYWVHWTVGGREHPPIYDLVVYDWNDDGSVRERVLISLAQYFDHDGSVGVIDATGRPVGDNREICDRTLTRDEVIGTPLAPRVFSFFDTIWLNEPRIDELRSWVD